MSKELGWIQYATDRKRPGATESVELGATATEPCRVAIGRHRRCLHNKLPSARRCNN